MIQKNLTRIFLFSLSTIFLSGLACGNACDIYKKMACENKNSEACHEAMQKIPDMTLSECSERVIVLKSGIK